MAAPLDVVGTLLVTDTVVVPIVVVLEIVVLRVLIRLGKDKDVLLVVNALISVVLLFAYYFNREVADP
jgi:hypothetical protein